MNFLGWFPGMVVNLHPVEQGSFPSTADTIGANNALVGLAVDEHANRLIAVCAIDNLVKGTGGAAIQSMNIALGLAEDSGLGDIALGATKN